jgi:hypothetical protein
MTWDCFRGLPVTRPGLSAFAQETSGFSRRITAAIYRRAYAARSHRNTGSSQRHYVRFLRAPPSNGIGLIRSFCARWIAAFTTIFALFKNLGWEEKYCLSWFLRSSWVLPIAATASATCSVRILDDVPCLEYFCGPSRGRSVWHRGFALRSAVLRNLHGGQDDDTQPTALGLVIPCFRRHFVFRSIS